MFKSSVPWYRSFEHTEETNGAVSAALDRSIHEVSDCLRVSTGLSKAGPRDVGSRGGGDQPLPPQYGVLRAAYRYNGSFVEALLN